MKSKCTNFVFLMETKYNRRKAEIVSNLMGLDSRFVVDIRGLNGGIAFLWNSTDDIWLDSYSQNHIAIILKKVEEGLEVLITGFYGTSF